MKQITVFLFWGTDTTEGTFFALAVPYTTHSYDTEVLINARQTTQVEVKTTFSTSWITVTGNWSQRVVLPDSLRITEGIETKGIILSSSKPVSVHLSSHDTDGLGSAAPDAWIVRPCNNTAQKYFFSSVSASQYMWSHYAVVATEDNTTVHVYYRGTSQADEHFTLNLYEVFSRIVYDEDFTGTQVVADKPVSVHGGGYGHHYASGGSSIAQYLEDSMPTADELGTEYTCFPVHFGGDGGYETRIVAVENDTHGSVPAFSATFNLSTGEYYAVNCVDTWFGFKVFCSKPCMVVQTVRSLPSENGYRMGSFMAVIVPDERASNHLIFTVPDVINSSSSIYGAISIIMNTYPVIGLRLNDTSLADLEWQLVNNSMTCYGSLEIEVGFYQLYSTEAFERFTAYLYVTSGNSAFGFAIGYEEPQAPVMTTTTLEPSTTTPLLTTTAIMSSTTEPDSNFTASGGNEGKRFAFSLPPSEHDLHGELIVFARQEMGVTLTYPFLISDHFHLEAGQTYHYQIDGLQYRCTEGIEHKGIMVTGTEPFSVHLTNRMYTHDTNPDSTVLRPIPENTDDVYIVNYLEGSASSRPHSFYMVVASESNTDVSVYKHEGDNLLLHEEFTLNANEVFTEDSDQDLTGYFVRASKPVAVYSGHGHAQIPTPGLYTRALFESMPHASEVGVDFVAIPYSFGDSETGYMGRVLSIADFTTISVPALNYKDEHDAGTFYDFDFPMSRHGTPVHCSQPCIAVQYAKESETLGTSWMLPFMIVLTPRGHYSRNSTFSSPSWASGNTQVALSLVVDFFPVDDLYLDGISLNFLDWTITYDGTGAYATLTLQPGQHDLYTLNEDHGFAAYFYATYNQNSLSYGYVVSYGDGTLDPEYEESVTTKAELN